MSDHWAMKYIGGKWSREMDCLEWFRRIQRQEFGRDLPGAEISEEAPLACTAGIMNGDIRRRFGWQQTDAPEEGDAVFLTQRNRPHHLGVLLIFDGDRYVLHALEDVGVICSSLNELRACAWKIHGYYTPCE